MDQREKFWIWVMKGRRGVKVIDNWETEK
jgi:hypothetical protein